MGKSIIAKQCTARGCNWQGQYLTRGMCHKHYHRWYRNGDPNILLTEQNGGSPKYLYKIWSHIQQRTQNPKDVNYKNYGGRGITFYEPWLNSFGQFRKYVFGTIGEKPSKGYSLDRIDNNKGYEPYNLRWATNTEQILNRRKNTNNKSGYIGVHLQADCVGWTAHITHGYKAFHIGVFPSAEEAAYARDQWVLQLRGEQASTNFTY